MGKIAFTFIQGKTVLEVNDEIVIFDIEKFTVDYKDGKIQISDLVVCKPSDE